MKRHVVIIQADLPSYRLQFHKALQAELAVADIELEVAYDPGIAGKSMGEEFPWATPVPIRRIGKLAWQGAFGRARRASLVVVQQEAKYLLNYLLTAAQFIGGPPVALWGHGRNFQAARGNAPAEFLKRCLSRHVHWWFAYGERSAAIVRKLGYPAARITEVENALDTLGIRKLREDLADSEISRVRSEIGLFSGEVAVFTGAMYKQKRLDFLLSAARRIKQSIPGFELIMIGKGADEGLIKAAARDHHWIHYVGAKSDAEKIPYWACSKLLLVPGAVGLVVLDSFALGVPLVTTDDPCHGPEIQYLKSGVNGLMVNGWQEPERYAEAVIRLFGDEQARLKLVAGAERSATRYTIENMASRFAKGIMAALDAPSVHGLRTGPSATETEQPGFASAPNA